MFQQKHIFFFIKVIIVCLQIVLSSISIDVMYKIIKHEQLILMIRLILICQEYHDTKF